MIRKKAKKNCIIKNGQLERISSYTNDQINGEEKLYHENGEFKKYHPNGQLKLISLYTNDMRNSECKEYYDNGQLKHIGTVKCRT